MTSPRGRARSAGGARAGAIPGRDPLANGGTPGDAPERALTVTALNTAIKDTLEGMLPQVWVSGEISQFKVHQNGHWYFTLKDVEGSVLDCTIWGSEKARFPAEPEVGMQVFARGKLNIWVKQPRIQFHVSALEDQGEGIWRKAFEQTKAVLERDGLLAAERKRALPRFPRCVAVVTSASGAAMHDIVSVIRRRNSTIDIVIVHAAVQGDAAPESLIAALDRVARWGCADVVIVGRGGGSREDLWCFNDERVARAIAACPVPTISAVGHEADVSIADFVADLRAATPTAAAELAVPLLAALTADLRAFGEQMRGAIVLRVRDGRRGMAFAHQGILQAARRRVVDSRRDLSTVRLAVRGAASRRATEARHALSALRESLKARVTRIVDRGLHRKAILSTALEALSPRAILARGYAVVRSPEGGTLTRAARFSTGAVFTLMLQDGEVDATASSVRLSETP